ncbi:hypothetical protein CsatB_025690 [Cannabis sativa]
MEEPEKLWRIRKTHTLLRDHQDSDMMMIMFRILETDHDHQIPSGYNRFGFGSEISVINSINLITS